MELWNDLKNEWHLIKKSEQLLQWGRIYRTEERWSWWFLWSIGFSIWSIQLSWLRTELHHPSTKERARSVLALLIIISEFSQIRSQVFSSCDLKLETFGWVIQRSRRLRNRQACLHELIQELNEYQVTQSSSQGSIHPALVHRYSNKSRWSKNPVKGSTGIQQGLLIKPSNSHQLRIELHQFIEITRRQRRNCQGNYACFGIQLRCNAKVPP